jgi:hypothetical protein
MAACHMDKSGKPYGNKYLANEGWHMKSVRTNYIGQADDQYLDSYRYSKGAPEAGRKTDPKTGGGYDDIKPVNGKPGIHAQERHCSEPTGWYLLLAN